MKNESDLRLSIIFQICSIDHLYTYQRYEKKFDTRQSQPDRLTPVPLHRRRSRTFN